MSVSDKPFSEIGGLRNLEMKLSRREISSSMIFVNSISFPSLAYFSLRYTTAPFIAFKGFLTP
jgi:hypothetical protein